MAHAAHSLRGIHLDLGGRIAAFRAWFDDYRSRRSVFRRTLKELSALSDRDLADLGIHRSMIIGLAREAAYGK